MLISNFFLLLFFNPTVEFWFENFFQLNFINYSVFELVKLFQWKWKLWIMVKIVLLNFKFEFRIFFQLFFQLLKGNVLSHVWKSLSCILIPKNIQTKGKPMAYAVYILSTIAMKINNCNNCEECCQKKYFISIIVLVRSEENSVYVWFWDFSLVTKTNKPKDRALVQNAALAMSINVLKLN